MWRHLAIACLLPAWAFAQDTVPVTPKSFAELYKPLPGVEYFCTDSNGQRIEIGGVICITASCQTSMARCEMSSNNNMAIWRKTMDGCPGADNSALLKRLERLQPVG